MTLSHRSIFVIVLIANTIIALIYLNVTLLYSAEQKLKELRAPEDEKITYRDQDIDHKKIGIFFLLQLFCPVAGPCFVGLAFICRKLFFTRPVDLTAVVFSKERVESRNPADVERESNIVPMEEALAVTDNYNLRSLMLNVLKGDISGYLSAISKALNSSDSETAHYAASVLRDELNDFRAKSNAMYNALDIADKETTGKIGVELIEYMNAFLIQDVFTPMEQENYVQMMATAAEAVYDRTPEMLLPYHYEWVALRLLETDDYKKCEEWTRRGMAAFPDELSSYTSLLKLYFKTENRDRFFGTLQELRESPIVLDQETLEIIRTFS
jgi:hypothetical protein